jgi:hypothetical protein
MLLLDAEELQIMASALQPPLRVQESDAQFRSIFQKFFAGQPLAEARILEIGPGKCGFTRLAAAAGAAMVTIDHDPAVVSLGRKRGYEAILADVLSFDWASFRGSFDGLFARHSIAAQWFRDPQPLQDFVDTICSVLKPDGWGWLVPWNRFRSEPDDIELMVAAQRQAFERNGFTTFELTPLIIGPDGRSYDHWDLFLRGLDPGEIPDDGSLRPFT